MAGYYSKPTGAAPFSWNRRKPDDRRTSCRDRSPAPRRCPHYRYRLRQISRFALAQSSDCLAENRLVAVTNETIVVEKTLRPDSSRTRRRTRGNVSLPFFGYWLLVIPLPPVTKGLFFGRIPDSDLVIPDLESAKMPDFPHPSVETEYGLF